MFLDYFGSTVALSVKCRRAIDSLAGCTMSKLAAPSSAHDPPLLNGPQKSSALGGGAAKSRAIAARTVAADKAHFLDVRELTPLHAYVQKGDRVEVTRPDWDNARYLVARYQGAKKMTVGLLDGRGLSCPPLPGQKREH
jgi:hypothetical protein